MSYRITKKRSKIWSIQANLKQAREKVKHPREIFEPIDDEITITIDRKATGEHVVFKLYEGTRRDNYSVYCNGEHFGIMGISVLMPKIGKALPSFRAE